MTQEIVEQTLTIYYESTGGWLHDGEYTGYNYRTCLGTVVIVHKYSDARNKIELKTH